MLEYVSVFSFNAYLALFRGPLTFWELLYLPLITTTLVIWKALTPRQLLALTALQLAGLPLAGYYSGGYDAVFSIPTIYFQISSAIYPFLVFIILMMIMFFLLRGRQSALSKTHKSILLFVAITFSVFNPVVGVTSFTIAATASIYPTTNLIVLSTAGMLLSVFGLLTIAPASVGYLINSREEETARKILCWLSPFIWTFAFLWALRYALIYFNVSRLSIDISIFDHQVDLILF
ncbi:hypothetical protein [Pseudovibrio sp. POLY-S9]|uniref:hypothetical protein n=1 Tax=Pseudovibrio sp. POLY-S9 TaxID=1576596 RepID=UPI00070BA30B|nr:hypothetical protein [Pseudovibrio sp. POLY-S9]